MLLIHRQISLTFLAQSDFGAASAHSAHQQTLSFLTKILSLTH